MANPNWQKGCESPNPNGRPRKQTKQTQLKQAKVKAYESILSAAHRGDPQACLAVLQIQEPV